MIYKSLSKDFPASNAFKISKFLTKKSKRNMQTVKIITTPSLMVTKTSVFYFKGRSNNKKKKNIYIYIKKQLFFQEDNKGDMNTPWQVFDKRFNSVQIGIGSCPPTPRQETDKMIGFSCQLIKK